MRISDWSSDVCSSDLSRRHGPDQPEPCRRPAGTAGDDRLAVAARLGRARRRRRDAGCSRRLMGLLAVLALGVVFWAIATGKVRRAASRETAALAIGVAGIDRKSTRLNSSN